MLEQQEIDLILQRKFSDSQFERFEYVNNPNCPIGGEENFRVIYATSRLAQELTLYHALLSSILIRPNYIENH